MSSSAQLRHTRGRPIRNRRPTRDRLPNGGLGWSLSGLPVTVAWDQVDATVGGGYGQLTARILPRRGRRVDCWQGDLLTLRRPSGQIAYQGKLDAPPKYVDDVAQVTATGPRSVVDRFNDRLPYQIAGGDSWNSLDADPANYTNNIHQSINPTQKGNSIGVVFAADTYATNDRNGFYLWVDGWDIQQVSGTMRERGANLGNYDLRIRHATPWNTATTDQTFTQGATNPDGTTFSVSIAEGFPVVVVDWAANSAVSPASSKHFHIDQLKVGVITTADTFSCADVATDVAGRCNYAVSASGSTNVLPLDWTAPATDLLDYLAAVEDSAWFVLADPTGRHYGKLYLRPYGHRSWHVTMGADAFDRSLSVLPLYDGYATTWENARGMPQKTRTKATDLGLIDPLPGLAQDYPEPAHIPDPQPDNTLAQTINAHALRKLTQLRVEGELEVRAVRDAGTPLDILPGDTITLGGFEPTVPAQRVAGVTYRPDGTVTCHLERDLHLDVLVRHHARKGHRHPGHRKRYP